MASTSDSSSIDPTRITFQVEALTADGSLARLPWGALRWEQQPHELAARIQVAVPDVDLVDGDPSSWIGQYLQPGTPLFVNAGLPGALTEQARGVVDGVSRSLDQQAPLTVTAYDPLYDLLAEQVNVYYPAGTSAAAVIQDLAGQFNVPVGALDAALATPLSSGLRFLSKTLGDIFTDLLAQTQALCQTTLLLRWNGGGGPDGAGALEVVQPGQNGTVLWFRTNVPAGQGNDSILSGTETLTRPAVTRVLVYQTPQRGTDAYNAALQPTDTGSQAYVGPGVLVDQLDGLTQYGVRQTVVQAARGESTDQAVARAQTILQAPGKGLPAHQITAIVPLVPGLQRGDRVQLTAGLTDGLVYVNSVSCDALSRTMTLQLVASQTELQDETADASVESPPDPTQDQATLTGGGATIPVPLSSYSSSPSSVIDQVLAVATTPALQGNAYVFGGPEGRARMDAPGQFQGTDCSGFVTWAYYVGSGGQIDLRSGGSTSTFTLYPQTVHVDPTQAQPGDLVFWNTGSNDPSQQHVALYLGNGQIVQDGGTRSDINTASVNQPIGSAPEFRRLTQPVQTGV